MSTTALVRSYSSPNNLARTSSSSNNLDAAKSQPQPVSPATGSPITLPKLSSTPQQSPTPVTSTTPQQRESSAASTPGRWHHPRMDEVIRRQNSTNFDTNNVRLTVLNVAFLILSLYIPKLVPDPWTRSLAPYSTYTLLVMRLFFTLNIGLAIAPLLRSKDACEDIPLTPQQRKLLGLPPMSRPATPQEKEQYITPPRYPRSATPRSSSSSMHAEISGSPLSGRGTPFSPSGSTFASTQQQRRTSSGSPLTPTGNLRSGAEIRRLSYNARSSPLAVSEFDTTGGNTPSKINNRASVGLNSKWLYEKGRGSPGAAGVSGNGWGTGSVFS